MGFPDAREILSEVRGSVPNWVDPVARYGFAAKGVVYATVGILTARAAWMTGRAPDGTKEALATIGRQPFGRVLLVITAAGLAGYAVWRFVEALYDPKRPTHNKTRLLVRTGFAISGLAHVVLAFIALSLAMGWGTGGESERTWAARLLALPLGYLAVGLVGATVVGVGIVQFRIAWTARFMQYDMPHMSGAKRHWAKRLGRYGLVARGVTFVIIGVFLIEAARRSNAGAVKGLGGALAVVAAQPFGPWLLLLVALGFLAYGIYCLSCTWFGRFPQRSPA